MDARVCRVLPLLMLLLPHLSMAWTLRGDSDRMETHRIGGAAGTPTQSVVFVWNSGNAEIKRLGTRGFLDVPVEDVDSQMRPSSPQHRSSAKVDPPTDEQRERLRTRTVLEDTVLPSVDFRDASVLEVLNVLQDACDRNPPEMQRVRFSLDGYATDVPRGGSVSSDGPALKDEHTPRINLQAASLSVQAVLDVIGDYTGLEPQIRTNSSVVVGWIWDEGVVYKLYRVSRSACAALARLSCETPPNVTSEKEVSDRLKQYIAALSGRPDDIWQVELLDRVDALVVCATPAVHKQIEAFLRVISDGERALGTYRMHAVSDADGGHTVLLFDTEEGDVWQYRAGHKDEAGNRCGERFALVPTT